MAVAAEFMCQAAVANNPGLEFVGYDDMRILKGVVLGHGSTIISVYADKAEKQPDGTYRSITTIKSDYSPLVATNAKAEVILAPKGFCLKPTEAHKVNLRNKYNHSIEETYNEYLFHGDFLRALTDIMGWSSEGMVAISQTSKPVEDWFSKPIFINWQSDPLMIDAAYQLMILWTTEALGAPSLPNYAKSYRQFIKSFEGQAVIISAKAASKGTSTATATIEFLNTDGKVLAIIEGYECTINGTLKNAFRKRALGA